MELPEWTIVVAPIGCSRLLVGMVPEMPLPPNTFDVPTGEAMANLQAHRQPDALEPGPLVGEGELKQERLRKEIGELEAAVRRICTIIRAGSMTSDEVQPFRTKVSFARWKLFWKRHELAALTESLAQRTLPSPTNDV